MKSMLQLAASVAAGGPDRNFRLGCVVKRRDGAVICSTNVNTQKPSPDAHAEARALRKTDKGATMWVARVNKDMSWTMARPCSRCQARIKNKGIKKVYYTISDNEWGVWHPQKEHLTGEVRKVTFNQHTKWEIK